MFQRLLRLARPRRGIPSTAPSCPRRLEKMLEGLNVKSMRGIEIAPLSWVTVKKEDGYILYVDKLSYNELLAAHSDSPHFKKEDIIPIDIVLGDRSIAEALADHPKFDYVVGSHVIEHIPDLVSWFDDIHSILKPDGTFRLAIPDRRFTFDYLRENSKLSEVLNAYAHRAKTPMSQSVMDHHLNVRKVDFIAAWDSTIESGRLERFHTPEYALEVATKDRRDNDPDIHCWTFTPKSFAKLMLDLAELRLLDFSCECIFDTEPYTFEFFVNMRNNDCAAAARSSWRNWTDSLALLP